jgi:2-polyprenyl-3-methyl-5-hydroxy-6-metoxy-1,4-benzoquinol methylase
MITVRSGKKMEIFHCKNCDFDFFDIDPSESLAKNKLDESRLKAAGLDIPTIEKDFENGIIQSQPYIDAYISEIDKGRNILEIGGSWGYFLKMMADRGVKPYGVELNSVRVDYVNEILKIPCYSTLESCEKSGVKFKQIFLFYVFEYVHEPVHYINRLLNMLEDGGRIVMITPNLNDPLKDIWANKAFENFFYDENAVNYFKPLSIRNLLKAIDNGNNNSSVKIIQGYSFINHVNWYLNNAPRTTGRVGGDYHIENITSKLNQSANKLGSEMSKLIIDFDKKYREIIEVNEFGNQIEVIIYK